MAIGRSRSTRLGRLVGSAALAFCATLVFGQARAARSTFRAYGVDQGLTGLSGYCMLQDRAGYLLVCSDHGVFEYDGRRFVNLGPDQGLPEGQIVYNLEAAPDGRVAIGYATETFVSDAPSARASHASRLQFHPVERAGPPSFHQQLHQLATWRNDFVMLSKGAVVGIATGPDGLPHIRSMGYDAREQAMLVGIKTVLSVGGHLWDVLSDGRLCIADPGAARCFGIADGLPRDTWEAALAGPGSTVLFRSALSVATFDPAASRWRVERLPDQGAGYNNYKSLLAFFRSPDGEIVTPSDHGLDVLGPGGWRTLTVADGAPEGPIIGAMTDASGQFWLQIEGRGLLRWLGYGRMSDVQRSEGLSADLAWQTIRSGDGALWVTTDVAVDRFVQDGRHVRAAGSFPGASFAITLGPRGTVWTTADAASVRIIDPLGGRQTRLAVASVNAIKAGDGDLMWIGSEHGLFVVQAGPGPPVATLASSANIEVNDVARDGRGGVFYLADGRLRQHRRDGTDLAIGGPWPENDFNPIQLTAEPGGALWVGGSGGLYRLLVSDDRVTSYVSIPTGDIRTNSVLAIMVDSRGWVWAGTTLGVSVFDGRRWTSFDTSCGLVSDDVSQGGLREDPDGSVWVATSGGLTHVLDPADLLAHRPLLAVVSSAAIGGKPIAQNSMPYTEKALTLQFGTSNYGSERSIVFRYRLSGVDAGWVDTASGIARYAFVPPGRHVLTVMAVDALSHRASAPITLPITIRAPWWDRWWSRLLWAACLLGLATAALRIHSRALLARQRELRRHVEQATAQLRHLATHDDLTGLLNRCEVERRLAAKLSIGHAGDESMVALIDLDHFKQVNDAYGHLGGDDVLRALGGLVAGAMRNSDYAGRYGGEELLVVVDDADGLGSSRILALHRSIRYDPFQAAGQLIAVTCSIGLAWARAGDNWETLVGRADQALYQAKRSGRDRIVESRNVTMGLPVAATADPGRPRPF